MQKPVAVRLLDWDFVLSDVDRHLVEHLVRRAVSPFETKVKSVRIEVVCVSDSSHGEGYEAKCHTELSSGKVVETVVLASAKNKLIGTFSNRLRTDVNRRLALESSLVYRVFSWARLKVRHLTATATKHSKSMTLYSRQIS